MLGVAGQCINGLTIETRESVDVVHYDLSAAFRIYNGGYVCCVL